MPQFYKDRALDEARDKDVSIDHSEVLEEKERDGYYPNELDEEMQDYNYGDKVKIGNWGYNYDARYRNRNFQRIYNQRTNRYYNNNKYNKWQGWGFKEQNPKIAPPFDPKSHFESPYYDYDSSRWGNNYWNRMKNGPW